MAHQCNIILSGIFHTCLPSPSASFPGRTLLDSARRGKGGGVCVCVCVHANASVHKARLLGSRARPVRWKLPPPLAHEALRKLRPALPRSAFSQEAGNPDLIWNFPMSESWQCITIFFKNHPGQTFFCLRAGSSHGLPVCDSCLGQTVLQSWRSKPLWTHVCSSLPISKPRFWVGSAHVCFCGCIWPIQPHTQFLSLPFISGDWNSWGSLSRCCRKCQLLNCVFPSKKSGWARPAGRMRLDFFCHPDNVF